MASGQMSVQVVPINLKALFQKPGLLHLRLLYCHAVPHRILWTNET